MQDDVMTRVSKGLRHEVGNARIEEKPHAGTGSGRVLVCDGGFDIRFGQSRIMPLDLRDAEPGRGKGLDAPNSDPRSRDNRLVTYDTTSPSDAADVAFVTAA